MRLEELMKELKKSANKSPKATVYVVQKDNQPLKVLKVRTSGDVVMIYVEETKPL